MALLSTFWASLFFSRIQDFIAASIVVYLPHERRIICSIWIISFWHHHTQSIQFIFSLSLKIESVALKRWKSKALPNYVSLDHERQKEIWQQLHLENWTNLILLHFFWNTIFRCLSEIQVFVLRYNVMNERIFGQRILGWKLFYSFFQHISSHSDGHSIKGLLLPLLCLNFTSLFKC